jgi:hypothetical protein
MKTRFDTLGTAENMSGSGKRDLTPSIPPKTCLGAENIKTGRDALGTTENEFGSAKHENGTSRHRYHQK